MCLVDRSERSRPCNGEGHINVLVAIKNQLCFKFKINSPLSNIVVAYSEGARMKEDRMFVFKDS